MYNLCLNYLQNVEEAEEITQDTFVKVYHSLSTFQGKSGISTWIYRIAINLCKDHIRSKSTQKRFGFLTSLFHPVSNEPVHHVDFDHPGILLENKESLETLFSFINALPESQKTAILLVRMEGLPQQEASEIMQISVKALESLLQRAKATIEKNYGSKRRI